MSDHQYGKARVSRRQAFLIRLIEFFPGFVDGSAVNGSTLADWAEGNIGALAQVVGTAAFERFSDRFYRSRDDELVSDADVVAWFEDQFAGEFAGARGCARGYLFAEELCRKGKGLAERLEENCS
ncbi:MULTISPECIES: hypothetical protein [unclassified Burkholderia]|uniref:hypothetical protein n=1 Tax=unclassified Burkholderia TaxID=2613784 RepID=UPI002AB2C8BD|nr:MULTISPECIES: hypothetical protein [unclassified Burkholderia]